MNQTLPVAARRPEVKSPAGHWPQLHAAIEAGADGVYFGLKHFTARAKAGFGVEEEREALADVLQGHAVAAALVAGFEVRILDRRMHAPRAPLDAHQHLTDARSRLDAVIDRVLEQRLQHHRRQQRIRGRRIELPADAEALPEAQLLDFGEELTEDEQAELAAVEIVVGAEEVLQEEPGPRRPAAALARLTACWDGGAPIAYPVAAGTACGGHGIAAAPALQAFLHGAASTLVSAGVRLIPLGQTDGQRVLAALEEIVAATAGRALATLLEDVGGAAFRADLATMRHETQYTRLFRS